MELSNVLGSQDGVTLFKLNFKLTEMRIAYLYRNITQWHDECVRKFNLYTVREMMVVYIKIKPWHKYNVGFMIN